MWSADLWDQYDGVCSHLDGRLEQVKRAAQFVKDRIKVEQDYAKELRKLSKSYIKMKPEETKFASTESFSKIVNHAEELAQSRDMFSTKLQSEVYDTLKKLAADQAKEKKAAMGDASKQQATYSSALASNEKMKKKCESAQQDADKTHLAYTKADADMTLSRAAVEKIRKTADLKQVELDEVKKCLQTSIDETNKAQHDHFYTKMPVIFKQLQQLDETRTSEMVQQFLRYVSLEGEMLPLWTVSEKKCKDQCSSIKPEADSAQLVDEIQTGLPIPGDISMDDRLSTTPVDKRSKKGAVASGSTRASFAGSKKTSSCEESIELFESLPPAKRKKKLVSKISDLKSAHKKEEAELKALEKLTSVYTANPSLGDPVVVQQKIQPVMQRCDAMSDEIYKLECALAQLENKDPPTMPLSVGAGGRNSLSSILSHSNEVNDVHIQTIAGVDEVYDLAETSEMKKSSSMTWGDDFAEPGGQQCSVLYDFTATSGSELSVKAGETLDVVQDDGSGWISVRRGTSQGYIPLSYVQMS